MQKPRLLVALFCASTALAGPASAAPPVPSTSTSAAVPTAEVDGAIAKLADPTPSVRIGAAQALSTTAPEAFPALEARVLEPGSGPGPMWLVLDKAKKSLPPGSPDDADVFIAVVTAGNTPAHRALALVLAGMKAAEKQGNVAGARLLVRVAVAHKGMLKSTATAGLKRMGDHAVAALLEVRNDADKDLRGWANKTLDGLGKFLPSDAVQVKDPQALADVLTAFGKTKDPDAARVLTSYLNADRAPVRDAARWAIAQYGNDGRLALKEAYEAFTSEKVGDDWSAKRLLDALVVAHDKVRLADVFKLFDEGKAHRDAGRLEEAVASYDALLARAPLFERRAELAGAYVDLARKKEPTDRPAARAHYAKAARLAAGTPLGATIDADVAYLDTLDLLDRGVADPSLLQRALASAPDHARCRELLARLDADSRRADDRLRRYALAGGAGLLAAILALLFVGKKSPPKTTPKAPPAHHARTA